MLVGLVTATLLIRALRLELAQLLGHGVFRLEFGELVLQALLTAEIVRLDMRFDVTVTRVIVAVGALFAFPMICGAYLVLAFLLPCRSYTGTERDTVDPVQRQVRSSPHDTLASVRYRFRDLDARLQRLEKYVTSSRYKLDREFRELEE